MVIRSDVLAAVSERNVTLCIKALHRELNAQAAAATMSTSRRVADHVEPAADIDERMSRGGGGVV